MSDIPHDTSLVYTLSADPANSFITLSDTEVRVTPYPAGLDNHQQGNKQGVTPPASIITCDVYLTVSLSKPCKCPRHQAP